jgi:hypothetical protein
MEIMEGPQLCLSLALAAKKFRPPLRAIRQLRTLLLGRVRCLAPFSESLNTKARQAHPCRSSLERSAPHHGRGDSFRRPVALRSWHVRGHRRNSDRERRCSSRSRPPGHHWGRCEGLWGTSSGATTTVSQRGMVRLRDVPDASTVVVGVSRRHSVFQFGRRILADSELDEDPSSDLPINADFAAR